tara:strand:- start:85698 stop:86198 length:501 start_codon:yes stop_codon:yes gene_type:complete
MRLTNEIVLRPRFKTELEIGNQEALALFEAHKNDQSRFVISRVDDHVFIRIPKHLQHFWSPQLHLEIIEKNKESSTLHGLFGPNPTVWTLFMFLHFAVITLFIGFGIWAYTDYTLDNSIIMQIAVMIFLIISWFVLYIAGRIGKKAGTEEMHLLYQFMKETLAINS